ncbi:uncharacterized protein LOC130665847 isoform X2 [Microplitis mediator]|nr:uncharacterized protein LOC130665847 isoform X2 [Microplitis mediator]
MNENIRDAWKKQHGNDINININELAYPGSNLTLQNINRKLWDYYYECLRKRYSDIGPEKALRLSSLSVLEGTSITLKCNICISPNDAYTIESIEWFYRDIRDINPEDTQIDTLDENIVMSSDDGALTLYNVQTFQEGLYWCKMINTLSDYYYLYVADENEPIITVRPEEAIEAQHPVPPLILYSYGLKVFSTWSPWSPCSLCNMIGTRVRYGHCTISLLEPPQENNEESIEQVSKNMLEDISDETENVGEQLTTEEKISRERLKRLARKVLRMFQNQLPCRSSFTPRKIKEIYEIKTRKTEIMKKFCKVKCPHNVVYEVRDRNGRVIETANNSAGIFSLAQGVPEIQPSVKRITLYENHGYSLKLKCPGNMNIDLPIVWKIGTKILNPESLQKQSYGRIFIDSRQQINFKHLRYADINIYSCWQRNTLAGVIRLEVSYEMPKNLDYRVMMLGAIPLISVFLYVYYRAWRGRNRFKKSEIVEKFLSNNNKNI